MDEAKQTFVRLGMHIGADMQALICCQGNCLATSSTTSSRILTHLRDKHGVIPDARKHKTPMTTFPVGFKAPNGIPPRKDGSVEHSFLQTHDKYNCLGCRFCTINLHLPFLGQDHVRAMLML